jgi:hypothetical protein
MQLYPVDGAVSRVERHETAFSYRDAKWSMVIVGVDPEPANAEKMVVLQLCSRTVEPKVVVDDRKLSLSQRTDRE